MAVSPASHTLGLAFQGAHKNWRSLPAVDQPEKGTIHKHGTSQEAPGKPIFPSSGPFLRLVPWRRDVDRVPCKTRLQAPRCARRLNERSAQRALALPSKPKTSVHPQRLKAWPVVSGWDLETGVCLVFRVPVLNCRKGVQSKLPMDDLRTAWGTRVGLL